MTTNRKVVQTPAAALYSGMSASATTCIISPYPVDLDGVKLTFADFGTTPTFTVDPKVYQYEEICSFTGIIDNGNNTATLTGITRDLSSKYPYTASGTGKLHGASAVVVFSNNPQVYADFAAKNNDETITALWTFSQIPILPASDPTTANQAVRKNYVDVPTAARDMNGQKITSLATPTSATDAASKGYVDGVAIAGAPDSSTTVKGIGKISSAPGLALTAPTITIASPTVVTSASHGLIAGDTVKFTTSGTLPTGIVSGTTYYVVATVTTNTFSIASTSGGTAINTSGSQSGTHTLTRTTPYFLNNEEVSATGGTSFPNVVVRAKSNGLIDTSFVAYPYPENFFLFAAGLGAAQNTGATPITILSQYVDSTNQFTYAKSSGTTLNYLNSTISGGAQQRVVTSDWASATAIKATVTIGTFLYVLLINGTTAYQLWRYTANNLAAGGTLCTFSGQSLAYNNTSQIMTSDGTNLFFNYKAGNSANDYVLSKYTVSGTALTYVSDITCGAVANVLDRILYIDSSTNIYGLKASDFIIRKYNSSGTLQTTSVPYRGNGLNATSTITMNSTPYTEDYFEDVFAQPVYFMNKLYL